MVETIIFDCVSPHCNLDLKVSKPTFLLDTLAHNIAWPYQVWLQKVQAFRRYCPDKHWKFEPLLWPWRSTQQSNIYKTLQLLMMYHQTKFISKRISNSEETAESYFNYISLHSDLDDSKPCFTTQSLITKGSAVQKILTGQTFTDIVILWCDLDHDQSNPISSQDTPANDYVPSN